MSSDQVGWVRLYRKTLDSAVWGDAELLKVWVWCLLRANRKEGWVTLSTGKGSTQVHLLPGQLVAGRFSAATELGMKPTTAWYRLQRLTKLGNLVIQPDTHFSVITICNWDTYQNAKPDACHDTCQATDTQLTPNCHPTDTNKNVKNVKKEEKVEKEEIPDAAADPEMAVVWDPAVGNWDVGAGRLKAWRGLYRNLSLDWVIDLAAAWRVEHPAKKYKNEAAFLGGWLRRENKAAIEANGGRNLMPEPDPEFNRKMDEEMDREFLALTPEERDAVCAKFLAEHPEKAEYVAARRARLHA